MIDNKLCKIDKCSVCIDCPYHAIPKCKVNSQSGSYHAADDDAATLASIRSWENPKHTAEEYVKAEAETARFLAHMIQVQSNPQFQYTKNHVELFNALGKAYMALRRERVGYYGFKEE